MKEHQLLLYSISNPEWLTKIQPEIFNPELRSIFRKATDIYLKGLVPTKESLHYILPEQKDTIDEVWNQELIDPTVFYLQKEELRNKAILEYTNEMSLLCIQNPDIKELKKNSDNLQRLFLEEEPESVGLGTDFFDLIKHIQTEGTKVYSGLKFLADSGSEPEKGQLMTFMAPSGNGKSTIMGDMCRKMFAKKYNVIYFAFEETEADFMLRIGRGLLKKTQYEYQNYTIDDLRAKWNSTSEKLGKLTVVTGVAVSAESIAEVIKENEETHNCVYDAVFIDYSSHINLTNVNKQTREDQKISQIFRKLKQLANNKDNEKLIITAVQGNRDSYRNNNMGADNAADSLGGIRESDLVMGVRLKTIDQPEIVTPENDYPNRVQGVFVVNTIKRRKGTLPIGSKFYYEFRADNNMYMIEDNELTTRLELSWDTMETLTANYREDVMDNNPLRL